MRAVDVVTHGLIRPGWTGACGVRAASTTRTGGLGLPPFATLNLGGRTADDPATVESNLGRVRRGLALPGPPRWPRQVHGNRAVYAGTDPWKAAERPEADAVWTDVPGVACAILTADCLPVVLAADDGACVGVAHAGWRGLAAGVIEACAQAMPVPPERLQAWLGPAIGPHAFVVGDEVRDAFLSVDPAAAVAFSPGPPGRWRGDLYTLARQRLRRTGVERVSGGGQCTFSAPLRFFSHRRDGGTTGRMVTLAWLD